MESKLFRGRNNLMDMVEFMSLVLEKVLVQHGSTGTERITMEIK